MTHAHSVPLHGRAKTSRPLQTTPPIPTAPRASPVATLAHALIYTCAHYATDWSVSTSRIGHNGRASTGRFCRYLQPPTAASIEPMPVPASERAILTARRHSQAARPCTGSLEDGSHGWRQPVCDHNAERPHGRTAARASPPSARAHYPWSAATGTSSIPARLKGRMSTCGSTQPDSRNAHACGKNQNTGGIACRTGRVWAGRCWARLWWQVAPFIAVHLRAHMCLSAKSQLSAWRGPALHKQLRPFYFRHL